VVERSVATGIGQHRYCVPAGTPDRIDSKADSGPAPFQGAHACGYCISGGYARAPPPANFRRASGAKNLWVSQWLMLPVLYRLPSRIRTCTRMIPPCLHCLPPISDPNTTKKITGACRLHLSVSNARKCSSFGANGCRIAAIQISMCFVSLPWRPRTLRRLLNSLAKPVTAPARDCAAVSSVGRLLARAVLSE
jgi:hypothetical protein